MYNRTITLFNRYDSRLGDTWYPTVLKNVDLNIDKASIVARYGAESTDNAILHVKYELIGGEIYIQGKKWLPPKKWDNQINEDLPNSLTFTDGSKYDFFYFGEWDTTPISESNYPEGFYGYMNTNYDFVFAITSVGGPYTVIPHFEILGK